MVPVGGPLVILVFGQVEGECGVITLPNGTGKALVLGGVMCRIEASMEDRVCPDVVEIAGVTPRELGPNEDGVGGDSASTPAER